MQSKNNTNRFGTIITIIILIILIIVTNLNADSKNYAGNIFSKILNPIQNVLTYVKNKIEKNDAFFENIEILRVENENLLNENENLKKELLNKSLIEAENETLKRNLKIFENYNEHELIYADIINRDITNLNGNIIINMGEKAGIEPGMVVIEEKGLVGYIVSTTSETSKVQVIIDTASTINAYLSNTREPVLCRGIIEHENSIRVTYISTDANIAQGDALETSGLGGIYPKGLPIGEVVEVIETNNIIDRYAIVKTYVDFYNLETLAVIKNI